MVYAKKITSMKDEYVYETDDGVIFSLPKYMVADIRIRCIEVDEIEMFPEVLLSTKPMLEWSQAYTGYIHS